MDFIVPVALEIMALYDALGKSLIGNLNSLVVGLFIKPSVFKKRWKNTLME